MEIPKNSEFRIDNRPDSDISRKNKNLTVNNLDFRVLLVIRFLQVGVYLKS